MAASQAPGTVVHELYEVALGASVVNTPAFRYRLARMASAAPFVMRPWSAAGQLSGRFARAAFSSSAMNWNTSARVFFSLGPSSVSSTIGTPPNTSNSR